MSCHKKIRKTKKKCSVISSAPSEGIKSIKSYINIKKVVYLTFWRLKSRKVIIFYGTRNDKISYKSLRHLKKISKHTIFQYLGVVLYPLKKQLSKLLFCLTRLTKTHKYLKIWKILIPMQILKSRNHLGEVQSQVQTLLKSWPGSFHNFYSLPPPATFENT